MSDPIEPLVQALADAPDDPEAFVRARDAMADAGRWRRLISLHEQLEGTLAEVVVDYWHDLLRLLERISGKLDDAETRSELLVAMGELWEHRLERDDQAILNYQAAFKTWPRNDEALDRARAVYVRNANHALVRRLWDLQLQVAPDDATRVRILCEMADIDRRHLDDLPAARVALQRAIELDPKHERARRTLDIVEGRARDWHAELASLTSAWQGAQGPRRAAAALRLAAFAAVEAPDGLADPLPWLEEAEAASPPPDGVGMVRAAVLRRARAWDALVRHLEAMAESAADSTELADLRADLAHVLRLRLDRPRMAETAARDALAVVPAHGAAFNELRAVLVAESRWAELAQAWRAWLDARGPSEELAGEYAALGELLWRRVADFEGAARAFDVVAGVDAQHETMLRFRVDAASKRGSAEEQVVALRALAEAVKGEEATELLERAARLATDAGGDDAIAVDLWQAVLARDPQHRRARAALPPLFEATGQFNRLVDLLRAEVDALPADDAARLPLLRRIAHVATESLHQPVVAAEAWSDILAISPADIEARDALEARYREAKRWDELVELLEARAASAEDDGERVEALRAIAVVWSDELDNVVEATEPLQRLLELSPDDTDALARLALAHETRGDAAAAFDARLRRARALDADERVEALADLSNTARALDDERRAAVLTARLAVDPMLDVEDIAWLTERAVASRDASQLGVVGGGPRPRGPPREGPPAPPGAALGVAESAPLSWWSRVLDVEPGHAEARDRALEMLVKRGDPDELATFARLNDLAGAASSAMVEHATVTESPATWLATAASLAHDAGEVDVERAALSALAAAGPTDAEALSRLAQLHREAGDEAAWARATEMLVPLVDAERASELRAELGRAYAGELHDPEAALRTAKAEHTIEPSVEAADRLVAAARAAGRPGDALDALRVAAARMPAGAERQAHYRHIASLAEEADDGPVSIDFHERLLTSVPDDLGALRALARRYDDPRDAGRCAEVLAQLIEATDDPEERRRSLVARAELLAGSLDRAEEAAQALQEVVDAAPDDPAMVSALRRALEAADDVDAARAVAAREVELAPDETARAEALAALASLAWEGARDASAAIDAASALLALGIETPRLAEAVADAIDAAASQPVEAWEPLLSALRTAKRPQLLVDALERLAAAAPEEAGGPALREVAELLEQELDDAESAYFTLARLVATWPSDEQEWDAMERLAEAVAGRDDLSARWAAAVDQRGEAAAPGLLLRLADLDAERGDHGVALALLRRAFDAGLDEAGERLSDMLRRSGTLDELADVLSARAQRSEGALRVTLLTEAADVLAQRSGRPEDAVPLLQAIVEERPDDPDAWRRLDALLQVTRDHAARISVLERWADTAAAADEVGALRRQQAELWLRELDEPSEAVEVLLAADVHDADELLLEAAGRLEPADDGALIRRAVDAVEPRARAGGDRAMVARVLEARLATLEPGDDPGPWHIELASLREEAGDAIDAFEHRRAAVSAGRFDDALVEALERGAAELERWADLAAAYEVALEHVLSDPARVAMHKRLGAIYGRRVSATHDAVASYEAALAIAPNDTDAIGALLRLRRDDGDPAATATLLEQQLASSDDEGARVEMLAELAQLRADALGDATGALDAADELPADRALAVFERFVTSSDPTTRQRALRGVAAGYEATEQPDERVAALVALVDDGDAAAIDVLVDALEDEVATDIAFEGWSRVLAARPGDAAARRRLVALAEVEYRWASYVAVLRGAAEVAEGAALADLWREFARVQEEYLDDPAAAAEALRTVLEIDGDAETAHALERVYQQEQDYTALVALWLERADVADTREARQTLLRRAAESQLAMLGDGEAAANTCEQLADLGGMDPSAIRLCERVWREAGRWHRVALLLDERARATDDAAAARRAWSELAKVYREHLDDATRALDALELAWGEGEARSADADDAVRAELAACLAQLDGDGHERAMSLVGRGDLAPVELRIEALMARADAGDAEARSRGYGDVAVLREAQREDAAAFDAWARALDADPSWADARVGLCRVADRIDAWRAAAGVLAQEAERAASEQVAVALWRDAARAAERAGDEEQAGVAWLAAVEAGDTGADALAATDLRLERAGRFDELARRLGQRVRDAQDAETRHAAVLRLADIGPASGLDADELVELLLPVLEMPAPATGDLDALEQAARAAARWDVVARTLERVIETSDDEHAAAARLELARVYRDDLEDEEQAIALLGRALEDDLTHDDAVSDLMLALAGDHAETAIAALEPVLRQAQAWPRLAIVLAARHERASGPDEGADAALELAALHLAQLEEPDVAASYATRAVEDAPGRTDVLAAAIATIEQAGFEGARAALAWSGLAEAAGERTEAALPWRRACAAWSDAGDVDEAWTCACRACEVAADDADAWAERDALAESREDWADVHLSRVRRAELEGDVEISAILWRLAAEVAIEHLNDPALALADHQRVIDAAPGDPPSVDAALGLLLASGRRAEAVKVLDAALDAGAPDDAQDRAWRSRLADLLLDLGDLARAETLAREALQGDGDDVAARAALGHVLAATGRAAEARPLLEQALASAERTDERARLHVALAHACPAGSVEAREHLEAALEEEPGSLEALRALAAHHAGTGDAALELDILDQLAHLADAAERVEVHRRRAEVAWSGLADRGRAIHALEALVMSDPDDLDAAIALAEHYRESSQLTGARQVVKPLLKRATGQRPRMARLRNVEGGIAEDEGRVDDAIVAYESAFSLDPENVDTVLALGRLLVAREAWERALKPLQAAMVRHVEIEDRSKRARLFVLMAETRLGLGERDRALSMARRALDIDAGNERAGELVAALGA